MRFRHARVAVRAALLLLSLALLTGTAAAQDTVWAPRTEQRLAPWFDAVRAELESAEVVVHAAEGTDGCASIDAALIIAQKLGVARALCLQVTVTPEGVPIVKARLARRGSQVGEGEAAVARGGFASAVREAYRLADLALSLDGAGLLRVQTTPQGAMISLDDEPIGHAPLDRHVAPGSHDVSVVLDGFATQRQSVEVARGRISEVRAKLVRATGDIDDDRASTGGATRASALNWWLGGALALGSVPLLAISLATLARDGSCAERAADGPCTARHEFGGSSAVLLGVGLAALIAGGSILVVQPFTVDVEASPDHALLTLRARL